VPWTGRAPLADLNTPFDEVAPFDEANTGRVWFASNRPGGAGGHDLWVAAKNTQGGYDGAAPVASVNTSDDELDVFRAATTARLWVVALLVDRGFLKLYCTKDSVIRILECEPVLDPWTGLIIWDCDRTDLVITYTYYRLNVIGQYYSVISLQPASSPISIPGVDGLLHLDPAGLLVLGSAPVGANGLGSLVWPTLPNLPGLTIHHQTLMVGQGTLRLSQVTAVRIINNP
jgi:hypothetical protein